MLSILSRFIKVTTQSLSGLSCD